MYPRSFATLWMTIKWTGMPSLQVYFLLTIYRIDNHIYFPIYKLRILAQVGLLVLLGFSQGIHNQLDLCRGETAGGIREADGTEVVHQVRIVVDPQHQFLAGSGGGDIRAIELGQLPFAIGSYLHQL